MKKLFTKVFEVKVTSALFVLLLIVSFLACAGINSCVKLLNLPNINDLVLLVSSTLYFAALALIALLNLIGIVKVKDN